MKPERSIVTQYVYGALIAPEPSFTYNYREMDDKDVSL